MDWKIWVISGLVLITSELLSATFVLAAFGLSAIGAGLADLVGIQSLTGQVVVFAIMSAALVPSSQFLRRRMMARSPGAHMKSNIDALVGVVCIVISAIDDHDVGQVRLGDEEWRARAENGGKIEVGARVRVRRVEGATLVVEAERPMGGAA